MKDTVNNNYEFVMKKILHFRERKLKITEKFESLSDEQREIENELKIINREKWGKGLEAGLINMILWCMNENVVKMKTLIICLMI